MKTSEFIKLLQEADPEDKCTVAVNNHPVRYCDVEPYYYDGRLEYIERKEEYGPVVRAGYKAGGFKLNIRYDTLEDALMDYPDAEIEYSGISYQGKADPYRMQYIDDCIKDGKEFQEWRKKLDESKKKGLPPPVITIKEDREYLQHKIHKWLKSLGLIK